MTASGYWTPELLAAMFPAPAEFVTGRHLVIELCSYLDTEVYWSDSALPNTIKWLGTWPRGAAVPTEEVIQALNAWLTHYQTAHIEATGGPQDSTSFYVVVRDDVLELGVL